jgi:hypothetical protein
MLFRGRVFRVIAAAAAAALGSLATIPNARASASPVSLVVSQSTGFAVLGHSCGGIQQYNFGSGFDPASGYPDGDVYMWTTCSSGGRGSHPTTYSAWLSSTWDFTGALVSYSTLASAPTVNPTLSVNDAHGNNLYNQSNQAFLVLAPGFVPAPRVSSVSPSSDPQGSTVTISGTGFTGATGVRFGTLSAAAFTVNSDNSINAVAPAVPTGTVDVTILGPGGGSSANSSDLFTFTLTPRVSGLKPNRGSADGGTAVMITGVNFSGTSSVSFGGIPAHFKVVNNTTIKARSPYAADPTAVYVAVTSPYGTSAISSADQFTYTG